MVNGRLSLYIGIPRNPVGCQPLHMHTAASLTLKEHFPAKVNSQAQRTALHHGLMNKSRKEPQVNSGTL
jgi:hypothetical protein